MSSNGGVGWDSIDSYYEDGGAVVLDPYDPLVCWSGGVRGGRMTVSKTTDGGESWTRYDLDAGYAYALAIDHFNTDVVYAGGDPGLFRTTDRGTTWLESSSGLTGYVQAIAVHPVDRGVVYAGTGDGVFKSTDAGASWENVGCRGVNALAIAGLEPNAVFAGTDSGVMTSLDDGGSWSAMNEGLDSVHVTSLGMVPGSGLYAGTQGASMYVWNFPPAVEEVPNRRAGGLLSVSPSPAPGPVAIRYLVARPARVRVTVRDALGRAVRRLADARAATGIHAVTWDGREDSGRPLPEGIYVIEYVAGDQRSSRKVVTLR